MTFNANNQIVAGNGVSYDAAGNVTADPTNTYTYDAENRIVSTTNTHTGVATTYTYDASGRRVEKTSGGLVTDYVYDLSGHAIAEFNSSGVWERGEVYVGSRHLATYFNSTTFFIHSDELGTERVRSNVQGASCETITSLPFGDNMVTSGSCGDISTHHFTGKERDSESGLDNFGARYDSSSFGRFTSPDSTAFVKPINPQDWNLYAYARNNPLLYVDPTGNKVSVVNCPDEQKCTQIVQNAAQLPKGVTVEVDKNGDLVLKGDLSQIKGGNALRLEQLVNLDKTVKFWIGDSAPGIGPGQTQDVHGGLSGLTSQGYDQNFAVVQADPSKVNSGDLHGVFLGADGSITSGDIPGDTIEEAAAHELLGHVWAGLVGGEAAGTDGNKKDALIAEDRVRNTDPSRGLKIRHQDSTQLVGQSDLPRITNPGSQP